MIILGKPKWAYNLLHGYVRWMYTLAYAREFEVVGLENVPTSGPVLYITNHQNNLPDALSLLFASPRITTFVARADMFKNPKAAKALHFLRILPMQRMDHGRQALEHDLPETMNALRNHLLEDGTCAIMIEGSSSPNRSLRPFKKGWSRLIKDTNDANCYPVVIPVSMEFSDWDKWGPDMRVTFGKPLELPEWTDNLGGDLKAMNDIAFEALSPMIRDDKQVESWHENISVKRRTLDFLYRLFGWPFMLLFILIDAPIIALAKNRVKNHHRKDFQSTLELGFIGLGTPLWLFFVLIGVGLCSNWLTAALSAISLPIIGFIGARTYIAFRRRKK